MLASYADLKFRKGYGQLPKAFVASHLSNLTKLSLQNVVSLAPLLAYSAPQLGTLKLHIPYDADLVPIVSWINSLTAIQKLSLLGQSLPLGEIRCARHALVAYQMENSNIDVHIFFPPF